MGETTITTTVEDEDEEIDLMPRVRRFRCSRCSALSLTLRTRCGSCGSLCTLQPVELRAADGVIHTTHPYRFRRRTRAETAFERGERGEPGGALDADRYGSPGGGFGSPEDGADDEEDDEEDDEPDLDTPEDISLIAADRTPRYPTGLPQLDAIFGGGLPRPSVIMLGATPGLGKSRLTAELSARHAHAGRRTLVVCAEESKPQVATRFAEMRLAARFPRAYSKDRLHLYKTQSLERLLVRLHEIRYDTVFVDSAFMLESDEVPGQAGMPSQLQHVVKTLYNRAHGTDRFQGCRPFTLVLIAHGTKANVEAGTNRAKHWIDAALFGERTDAFGEPLPDQSRPPEDAPQFFRIFSTGKSRFGANGVAHFEMTRPDGIPVEREPASEGNEQPATPRRRRSRRAASRL